MTKQTQETEGTGYSLGGLSKQLVESIENEIIDVDLIFPTHSRDKK